MLNAANLSIVMDENSMPPVIYPPIQILSVAGQGLCETGGESNHIPYALSFCRDILAIIN